MVKNSSTELPKSNPEAMMLASLLLINAVPVLYPKLDNKLSIRDTLNVSPSGTVNTNCYVTTSPTITFGVVESGSEVLITVLLIPGVTVLILTTLDLLV